MAGGEMRTCILSHGRSGTLYTAKVFRAIGLDFGHEQDGADGAIGAVFWKGKRNLATYNNIFHQVRHPLNVIASSLTCKDSSYNKVYKELAIDFYPPNQLAKVMHLWIQYTEWADARASFRYQVEHFASCWRMMLMMMGLPKQPMPTIDPKTNHRDHAALTWPDLFAEDKMLASEVQRRAGQYGYETT